jgi:hypothetical protein
MNAQLPFSLFIKEKVVKIGKYIKGVPYAQ